MIEVKVPQVGESITEVQVGRWLKDEGQWVDQGEDLVEIETEKASVQIPAPAAGILRNIRKKADEFAVVNDVVAEIEPSERPADQGKSAGGGGGESQEAAESREKPDSQKAAATQERDRETTASTGEPRGRASGAGAAEPPREKSGSATGRPGAVMPAAQRLLNEHGLRAEQVPATGPGGRLLKEDVQRYVERQSAQPQRQPQPSTQLAPAGGSTSLVTGEAKRSDEIKPMSMIRRTIAARLVEAQQTAALLTTFNEIDMSPVMALRNKYRDAFQQKHGVKLGFMSFFARAAVEALRRYPAVNAEVRDSNVVYHHYYDIGIAIGGGKGLVVPVLRNVEQMSFADVERAIGEYAQAAMANQLNPEDLIGGTFTISNGGVYGSMLSTPIVNPPQSGILGLHAIQERPIAVDGQVVVRPMMYVALTYDHRIIDGREAVGFLKTIKEVIEDPTRLFLEV